MDRKGTGIKKNREKSKNFQKSIFFISGFKPEILQEYGLLDCERRYLMGRYKYLLWPEKIEIKNYKCENEPSNQETEPPPRKGFLS